jgi:hypothetical protein
MKKVLIGLVLVVAVIGILLWQLYANLDSIVEQAVEEIGTDVTGTAVAVDNVELQLLEGKAGMAGLEVSNPPGFSGPAIFRLGRIAVSLDIESLKDGPIVIDELRVSQPQVFLEMNSENQSNLTVLRHNIETYQGTPEAGTTTESADQPAAAPVKFIIRKLAFEGGRLSATSALAPDKPVAADLPGFEMADLGKAAGGATGEQLAREILARLIQEAGRAAGQAGIDAAKQELGEKAREKLDKKFGGALDGILKQ